MTRPRRAKKQEVGQPNKPVEVRPMSDNAQLRYQQMMGPMQVAINAVLTAARQAQEVIARTMLEADGLDMREGWRCNADKMQWERYRFTE